MYDFLLGLSLWRNVADDKASMFVAQYLVILGQTRRIVEELVENIQARGQIYWTPS